MRGPLQIGFFFPLPGLRARIKHDRTLGRLAAQLLELPHALHLTEFDI